MQYRFPFKISFAAGCVTDSIYHVTWRLAVITLQHLGNNEKFENNKSTFLFSTWIRASNVPIFYGLISQVFPRGRE